ncbi:MAG: DUF4381 domain-containing protein [Rubripirellula sp.]
MESSDPAIVDPASLDRLNDFVLPETVGFLPLAPVWKFGLVLVLLWLAKWAWIRIVAYIRNAYRREAVAELKVIEASGDVVRLNELLKRTAITAYGRDAVASLYGDRWLEFLGDSLKRSGIRERTDSSPETLSPVADVSALGDVSSRTSVTTSREEHEKLFEFARVWIRQHVPLASEVPSC